MSTSTFSPMKSPLTPKIDFNSGPQKSHFFQPPPSSASSSLQNSTVSLQTSILSTRGHQSRKRARHEDHITPRARKFTSLQTPPSLLGSRCDLRLDRRSLQSLPQSDVEPNPERCRERTGAGWNIDREPQADEDTLLDGLPNSPSIRDGLGNVMYRFAGVAGKVWKNWSTSFRGFCAGEGQGYELKDPIVVDGENERWQVIKDDESVMDVERVPGGFPEDDYIPNYMSQDHTTTPIRASKRSRYDAGMSEKWVLAEPSADRDTSPPRLPRKHATPSSNSARRIARRPRRAMPPSSTSSAAGLPRPSPHRASYASTRTPTKSAETHARDSPVNLEVRQHAARIRRKEAEEEANLKRLNLQLKAMIREGKEALATKFEIEDTSNEENVEPGFYS